MRVVDRADCVLWTGPVSSNGYGRQGHEYAHRIAWEAVHGPIPAGMQIDHLCRVRLCVNVDHLELVTQAENIRRGESPNIVTNRRQVCRAGHPYEGNRTASRNCRPCQNAWRRQRRHSGGN